MIKLILLLFPLCCFAKHGNKQFADNSNNTNDQIQIESDLYNDFDYLNIATTHQINNYTMGISLQNYAIYGPGDSSTYGYVSKEIDFEGGYINIGSQMGSYNNRFSFEWLGYGMVAIKLDTPEECPIEDIIISAGPYYANKNMAQSNTMGVISQININTMDWFYNMSYVSGVNAVSGLSANIGYNFGRIHPYIGYGASPLEQNFNNPYAPYLALGTNIEF